uniref:Uncharacterized protein n=1 Tax=Rhizophora mucronata TaxID=61149 RepID=A0A2P2Q4J5_RHIMU
MALAILSKQLSFLLRANLVLMDKD